MVIAEVPVSPPVIERTMVVLALVAVEECANKDDLLLAMKETVPKK
jgi:hypothetical protein